MGERVDCRLERVGGDEREAFENLPKETELLLLFRGLAPPLLLISLLMYTQASIWPVLVVLLHRAITEYVRTAL